MAPLDWGLGHATRLIPVIHGFIEADCNVIIAAEGSIRVLLQQEFPQLLFLDLKGYEITYSNRWMPLKLASQIPKIIRAIRHEQRWLKDTIELLPVDIIISDNRYGLYSKKIRSVILTHQLQIQAPAGKRLLQRLTYRYITRFSQCWVPDEAGIQNLGGALSHPALMPLMPVRYIGILSRLVKKKAAEKYLLILLSGPEPQRTALENKIIKNLAGYTEPVVLVRGLPGHTAALSLGGHITVHNHLPAKRLNEVIAAARLIISRSGYSTVMDIMKMEKKAVFIPTPGQTEQEYLAAYLQKQGYAVGIKQKDFSLVKALRAAAAFDYKCFESAGDEALSKAINALLQETDGSCTNPVPGKAKDQK